MSAQTYDVHQRQMDGEKFGSLQRLRAAFWDGRLKADSEAWMEIDPDFVFQENNFKIQVQTWTWTSQTRFKRFGVRVHQSTGLNLIIKVQVQLKRAQTQT